MILGLSTSLPVVATMYTAVAAASRLVFAVVATAWLDGNSRGMFAPVHEATVTSGRMAATPAALEYARVRAPPTAYAPGSGLGEN